MAERILYNPYPHQQYLHDSNARFKYNMEPVRSGKGIWLVNEVTKKTIELMKMWKERPDTMSPKWNVWFVGETFNLVEQLWRDVLAYTPSQLLAGEPSMGKMEIPIVNGGRYKFRSAKNEAYLVAEGLDLLAMTEAGEIPTTAWELLQSRLSSPDRLKYSSAAIEGTPRGQIDPADPTKDQWFWSEVKASRLHGANKSISEAIYWFEDRMLAEFGGGKLEHPMLSLTPEGREELDRQRNNPNLSELKFREDYLGECLPTVLGKSIIRKFMPEYHVSNKAVYSPRYKLYRLWDFSRNYPAVTFHQRYSDDTWAVIDEYVPIEQDLLDTELAENVIEWTGKNHARLDKDRIFDIGDFEATHKQDSRRDTTVQALAKKGINLLTNPTKPGDEALAIEILNARLKLRQNGAPNIIIHPRCNLTIRCFAGMWIHEVIKVAGIESYRPYVAEQHPWIDIFDTFKMFIVNVLDTKPADDPQRGRRVRAVVGDQGEPIGTEVY